MTLELFFWLSSSFSWLNFYVADWMTKLSTHSLRWQSILGKNPVRYFIKLAWNDREKAKWLIESPNWAFSHHFARFLKLLPELLKMMLLDCSVWACTVQLFLLFQNYLQSWQYKITVYNHQWSFSQVVILSFLWSLELLLFGVKCSLLLCRMKSKKLLSKPCCQARKRVSR